MRKLFTSAMLTFAMLAAAMDATAESVSSATFRIDIEDGWVHDIEAAPGADPNWGNVIRVRDPNGPGVLTLRSYTGPAIVEPDVLRNMTNVPFTTSLTLQPWGDYTGYQHDYVEGASFYRQWWLTHENVVVFVTYQCSAELSEREIEPIDALVDSLAVTRPDL